MDTLSYIVNLDNAITTVLKTDSPYKLQQLTDMYRTSPDKEEFFCVLCTRLLLESKRPSSSTSNDAQQIGTVLPLTVNQQHGG